MAIGGLGALFAVIGSLLPWSILGGQSTLIGISGIQGNDGQAVFGLALLAALALAWRIYANADYARPQWMAIANSGLGAAIAIIVIVDMARLDTSQALYGYGSYVTLIGGLGLIGSGVLTLVQLKREEDSADDSG